MSSVPATSTAVLGGGIAGLAAAHYLATAAPSTAITLFEAARRLGGWIRTEQHPGRGFRFERGPRTIRPAGVRGANTLRLIEDLQLQDSLVPIARSHVAARNRQIYVHNQLHMLPSSLAGLFRRQTPFSRPLISAALNDLRTGRSPLPLADESIYDFAHRRFGAEVADYLISPMICGICAGDARQVSVNFLMDELFRKEQKYGGVVRGTLLGMFEPQKGGELAERQSQLVDQAAKDAWSVYSFRHGLEQLPLRLGERLAELGASVHSSSDCRRIQFGAAAQKTVTLTVNGSHHQVEHLVSSLPSHKLAPLLAAEHPQLAGELAAIPYVDVAVVNLQFEGDQLLAQPGFGFLVPPAEKLPILGVIYDSCCFPMPGKTVLTVMMGGAWFAERLGAKPSEAELLAVAQQQVQRILGIEAKPEASGVHILPQCIPQYVVGHRARVGRIREYIREQRLPLSLCGAAYDGVGVNDVIWSARQAAIGIRGQ